MSGLLRIVAKPLPSEEVDELIGAELARIRNAGKVDEIILFGSAARGEMTNMSDLDFVAIYATEVEKLKGRKEYFQSTRGKKWPSDVLFVTREFYDTHADIGGVFFVCKREGRSLFRRNQ